MARDECATDLKQAAKKGFKLDEAVWSTLLARHANSEQMRACIAKHTTWKVKDVPRRMALLYRSLSDSIHGPKQRSSGWRLRIEVQGPVTHAHARVLACACEHILHWKYELVLPDVWESSASVSSDEGAGPSTGVTDMHLCTRKVPGMTSPYTGTPFHGFMTRSFAGVGTDCGSTCA